MKLSKSITENVTATLEIAKNCRGDCYNITINNFIHGKLCAGSFNLTKEDLSKLKEYIDKVLCD